MTIPEINLRLRELIALETELWAAKEEAERESKKKWLAVTREIDLLRKERDKLIDPEAERTTP